MFLRSDYVRFVLGESFQESFARFGFRQLIDREGNPVLERSDDGQVVPRQILSCDADMSAFSGYLLPGYDFNWKCLNGQFASSWESSDGVSVMWNNGSRGNGQGLYLPVNVDVWGSGCDSFLSGQVKLFRDCTRISRFDLALDVPVKKTEWLWICRSLNDKMIDKQLKKLQDGKKELSGLNRISVVGSGAASTFYFGSRSGSQDFLRVYNKSLQSKVKHHKVEDFVLSDDQQTRQPIQSDEYLIRFEIEFKRVHLPDGSWSDPMQMFLAYWSSETIVQKWLIQSFRSTIQKRFPPDLLPFNLNLITALAITEQKKYFVQFSDSMEVSSTQQEVIRAEGIHEEKQVSDSSSIQWFLNAYALFIDDHFQDPGFIEQYRSKVKQKRGYVRSIVLLEDYSYTPPDLSETYQDDYQYDSAYIQYQDDSGEQLFMSDTVEGSRQNIDFGGFE